MQFKQNKIKPNKNDNPLLPDTLREEFSLARYQRNPVTQELQHEIDTTMIFSITSLCFQY